MALNCGILVWVGGWTQQLLLWGAVVGRLVGEAGPNASWNITVKWMDYTFSYRLDCEVQVGRADIAVNVAGCAATRVRLFVARGGSERYLVPGRTLQCRLTLCFREWTLGRRLFCAAVAVGVMDLSQPRIPQHASRARAAPATLHV
ncbi:unnamed protein product, partial [Iphiclides podalirius]